MKWDFERTQRLWARDSLLWTGSDESQWMDWLFIESPAIAGVATQSAYAEEAFSNVVLLGMGGSSLCARVFEKSFGHLKGSPRLHVLDSTDPAQILACENAIDLDNTLFIVSSKSGSTLETNVLFDYFRTRGKRFVAITDAGSSLDRGTPTFEKTFYGVKAIGGRYSALSNFGMVPAALMGVDVQKVLQSAKKMSHACGPSVSVENNPGVQLGLFLGENALHGRDKLTLLISPQISELGAWIEQLIAESTGKQGKGIVPIHKEPLSPVAEYSRDRQFVYIRLDSDDNEALDALVGELAKTGYPVHHIQCVDKFDLGAEFFRWEFATAVAGSILQVNPFDQPDVEATKVLTRRFTDLGEASVAQQLKLSSFKELVATLSPHDYFSICAFIEMNDENEHLLGELRSVIRKQTGVATTLGFGPCYLHSTGQLHKGGPNSGAFLILTCDDEKDLEIPGRSSSFGRIKNAQALADLSVLVERERRCAHVHIQGKVHDGLLALLQNSVTPGADPESRVER